VDFDSLGVEAKTFLLVGEELFEILALVTLELNHLSHLLVGNDSAIASYVPSR